MPSPCCHRLSRRAWLAGLASALPVMRAGHVWAALPVEIDDQVKAIERRLGGRLGAAALETTTGRRVGHRASERFAMCSTFKLLAAAATLARIDAGQERLDRIVRYGPKDLLDYAPVAREHVEGGMTVEALMVAALQYSDNTAANLLLARLGGPSGVTKFARRLGDRVTRLDRNEPSLNVVGPGDVRDTTSPMAMLGSMRALLVGTTALTAASRERLTNWLIGNTTGNDRLRAGLPSGWRVGDKTGTGPKGETNDVAIAWPSGRAAILITAYFSGSSAPEGERNRGVADVARIVAAAFA